MEFLLVLIGLILIVEGLPYAAFPEAMQRWLAQMQQLSPVTLRKAGLVMLGLGLLLIYLARRTNFFS
ncbi:DUF2065 domain-containing protein [Desulfurivibrio alkaliphilus]|uniref:DUF2065 domain-containing protein n=1 Tax=Desulfurivibrio alkaliphilus (strain DSM 19089 / UNIQEM U267 / AHT2) TaxID=589865 RepID=D6Z6K9_DESAT|nr:DUF2065 domain-containing protein [Desulfurivibrio alkaliphilus]ADH84968.1 Protein of unknown function DUF2065 [Desulfurivibrio alkaliphilus AHT 2]